MRWDDLFDDLAGQASAVLDDELRTETDERARAELGRLSLLDRLALLGAQVVDVDLVDGRRVHARLAGVGDGWFRLEDDHDELLVPGRALARLSSVPSTAPGAIDRPLQGRLGLRPVLRALVRRRVYVRAGFDDRVDDRRHARRRGGRPPGARRAPRRPTPTGRRGARRLAGAVRGPAHAQVREELNGCRSMNDAVWS